MSTANTGDEAIAAAAVADARKEIQPREEQLNLLDPVTPEEMLEVREDLGPNAGQMTVLREARRRKAGRQPGSRNKRTDDFARYILSFGPHPARALMDIASSPPEVLIENSRRTIKRITKKGDVVHLDEAMSYETAISLKLRAAEAILPYIESKKPVAVDMSLSGISDLIIAGVTHSEREVAELIEADFLEIEDEERGK